MIKEKTQVNIMKQLKSGIMTQHAGILIKILAVKQQMKQEKGIISRGTRNRTEAIVM